MRKNNISMPSIENTLIPEAEEIYDFEFDSVPSCEVGDYRTIGKPNKYDQMACGFQIDPMMLPDEYNEDIMLPSGYCRRYVTDIKKRFRPKKGMKINSWYSFGDYSGDDRFESYYDVQFEDKLLWYSFSEFLLKMLIKIESFERRLDNIKNEV